MLARTMADFWGFERIGDLWQNVPEGPFVSVVRH
jgi:hypothetical protein